jgi:hypothetical protein
MFPKRYVDVTPEGYPDLTFRLWANPTGAHMRELFGVAYPDQAERIAAIEAELEAEQFPNKEEERAAAAELAACKDRQASSLRLGLALVASYDGGKVEAYGYTFDLSSPEAAVRTVMDEAIPDDLRYWLLNAPVQIVEVARDDLGKSLRSASAHGKNSTARN